MSARGAGTASGPWGRLKPVNLDYLDTIGLPSKGDNRLLDRKTQERYYTKIVERYMAICSDAGQGDELLRRLGSLTLNEDGKSTNKHQAQISSHNIAASGKSTSQQKQQTASNSTIGPGKTLGNSGSAELKDLSTLMMAMRKLREGIIASNRVDDFSIQAYIFCIRVSILGKHMESYHPATLHLLKRMHTVQALSTTELQEFVGYLVLDLACRQNDLAQAYLIRRRYALHDPKVDAVLRSLAHDNYFLFWRVKRSVDGHKAKIMEFAEDDMKRQSLKCLGRSYFTMDLPSLERVTNTSWPLLTEKYGVGWQLEGAKVVIRTPKTR